MHNIVRRETYPNMLRSIVHEFGHGVVGEAYGFALKSICFKYVLPDLSLRPRPIFCDIGGATDIEGVRDSIGTPRFDKSAELMAIAMAGIVAESLLLGTYEHDMLSTFREKNRYAGDRDWICEITYGPLKDEYLNNGIVGARAVLKSAKSSLLYLARVVNHHIHCCRFPLPHYVPEVQLEQLRALASLPSAGIL